MKITVFMTLMAVAMMNNIAFAEVKLKISSLGKTNYSIVTGGSPSIPEQTAVKELAKYLNKVTKVGFQIVSEGDYISGPAFYVGWTSKARSVGLDGSKMKPEEWAIKTSGHDIILTGGRARGTLYAVYHFLEDHIGVRWWNVSEEYVPSKPILKIAPISRRSQPAFLKRDICIDGGGGEYTPMDDGMWAARNRLNATGHRKISVENGYDGGLTNWPLPWVAHTLTGYVFSAADAKDHPERYGWNGTTRDPEKLCMTNPEVKQMAVDWYDKYVTKTQADAVSAGLPVPRLFNMSEADTASKACWEPNCIAVRDREGCEAGVLLSFINDVADKLKEKHPDDVFETLAYWNTDTPPKYIKPASNVGIRLCDVEAILALPITNPLNKRFEEKVRGWGKITEHLHIWDYGMSYRIPEPPLTMEFCLQPDYKLFRSSNVSEIMVEMEDSGLFMADNWHMRAWMMAKLMENPDQDPRQLLFDYTEGYYGRAGRYIREFRYMTHKAIMQKPPFTTMLCNESPQNYRYIDIAYMKKAGELLDKASRACGNDETLKRRVAIARLSYDRTVVGFYSLLLREWLQKGKSAQTFPLNRAKAAERVAETVSKIADFYLVESKRAEAKKLADEMINTCKNMRSFWSLPDFTKGSAAIVEQTPQDIGYFFPEIAPVKDEDADCGVALKYTPKNPDPVSETVFQAGIWHAFEYNGIYTKDLPGIKRSDVTGSGYNWYKLASDWNMTRGDKMFLLGWGLQTFIDSGMLSAKVGGSWDIWAHVKFEGPAYPKTDPDKQNAVYVERIILVRK